MYNLLSLLLGILALIFAAHSFRVKGCLTCCTVSGGCCGLALLFQLADCDRLAGLGDASAFYDTIHARFLAGAVLLAAVVGLNLFALLRSRKSSLRFL